MIQPEPKSEAVTEPVPRWKAAIARARKPVLVIAGVGTVLGGLASYLTVYRTVAGTVPSATATSPDPVTAADPISILVLPLANHTGDPAKAYMADGLTTAITGDLSRIQDAVIVPPVTAVALQDKKLTLSQLGTEARVRFVLQGGVGISGERLRVHAQLSDTRSGRQLWSQVFEAPLGDLFTLQDDMTVRIRTSIGPQMVLLAAREAKTREKKPQVADIILRLRALDLQQQSLPGLKQRVELAQQALAIDPDSLRARQILARSLSLLAANFAGELGLSPAGQRALVAQAAVEARRVLTSEPDNVQMLYVLAIEADDTAALKILARAVEIDPRSALTYQQLGMFHRNLGQNEQAREALMKSMQLPSYLPPAGVYQILSTVSRQEGRYDEAIDWAQKSVQANPDIALARATLALAYAMKGDERSARVVTAELYKRFPGFKGQRSVAPWPGREAAHREYVESRLKPAARLAGLRLEE